MNFVSCEEILPNTIDDHLSGMVRQTFFKSGRRRDALSLDASPCNGAEISQIRAIARARNVERPEIGPWPPKKSLFLAGKSTVPQKNLHFCPIFEHFNLRSFTDLAIFRSGPSFFAMKMG